MFALNTFDHFPTFSPDLATTFDYSWMNQSRQMNDGVLATTVSR